MRIKVGEIPYLNCLPFFWRKSAADKKVLRWLSRSPRKLGALARRGKIDAGPISLADSFALEKDFEPLGDMGIAVKNSARSVLLFSKVPLRRLGGCVIGVTRATVTSARLLEHLLREKYGLSPRFRRGFHASDQARLFIGDEALARAADARLKRCFPYLYDLGREWQKWKKLPFVFARWMVRRDLSAAGKRDLLDYLARNLRDYNRAPRPAIREYRGGMWEAAAAKSYLSDFRHKFGPQEKKAVGAFRQLLGKSVLTDRT